MAIVKDRYSKKNCLTCGIEHRKRGPFCSKVCSNSGRDGATRQKISEASRANNTIAHAYLGAGTVQEPPDPNKWGNFSLAKNQFIDQDGDIWTSCD